MKKFRVFGHIFFWLTLVSPIIAFAFSSMVGNVYFFGTAGMLRYTWLMWFFIPFGVTSFIIGIILKRNKEPFKKNFIIAFICVPFIIILGSYRFIFNDMVSYDKDIIIDVENEIGLDLPNDVEVGTSIDFGYTETVAKITNAEEQAIFNIEVQNNDFWTTKLPPQIKGLFPQITTTENALVKYDYFVFYNATLNEYNIYPTVTGSFKCVIVAYDVELSKLYIISDYTLNID